ncbi:hypothetical protein D3C78_1610990 [compost metagenome]
MFGGLADNKPGINSNAVSTYPRTRLQDIDPWVAVGQADQFPDVDVQLVADDRQLVGEGDVHVTEAVLRQLAHFRSAGVGDDALAFDENLVQGGSRGRAFRRHTTDHTVVLHQFAQHMAG